MEGNCQLDRQQRLLSRVILALVILEAVGFTLSRVTLVWDDNDSAQPGMSILEFLVPLLPLLIAEKTLLNFLTNFLDTPQQAVNACGRSTVLIAKCAIPTRPLQDCARWKSTPFDVAAAPTVDLAGMTLF